MLKPEELNDDERNEMAKREDVIRRCFDEAHLFANKMGLSAQETSSIAFMIFSMKNKT